MAHPGDPGRLRLLALSPLLGWATSSLGDSGRWDELSTRMDGLLARAMPELGLLGCLSQVLGDGALADLPRQGRLLADLQQSAEIVQDHDVS